MSRATSYRTLREDPLRFYAACDEEHRVDAFAAALSALVMPGWFVRLSIHPFADPDRSYAALPVERAVAVARSAFGTDARIGASFWTMTSFGHGVPLTIGCADEKHERRSPDGPLSASSGDHHDLLPRSIDVAVGTRSVEVEAAVMSVHVQQDINDFFLSVSARANT